MRIIVKFDRVDREVGTRVVVVLVVNRFRVPEDEAEAFRADLEAALAVLAQQKGYADGRLGRNVDDPTLWAMVTRWRTSAATAGRSRRTT